MAAQPTDLSRDVLVGAIVEFLAEQDLLTLRDVRAALEREIDEAGPDALLALKARLLSDFGWDYYPPDPLARRIHHVLADRILGEGSELRGVQHAEAVASAPVVVVANHLSYADANAIELLLQRSGGATLADRLTALAGPKVFTSRQRRFSSLCFGNVKVPQSSDVSSEEAVLSIREVAKAARQSIDVARKRLRDGDALLLFAEGTRSRRAQMQTMLSGGARYFEEPGTWVLPVGLVGPERLFPVEQAALRPARLVAQIGRPILADGLLSGAAGDRRLVMDTIGLAVAAELPEEYRGVYRDPKNFPAAERLLRTVARASEEEP